MALSTSSVQPRWVMGISLNGLTRRNFSRTSAALSTLNSITPTLRFAREVHPLFSGHAAATGSRHVQMEWIQRVVELPDQMAREVEQAVKTGVFENTAEVVRVDQNLVVVNAGLKSEIFIAVEEFRN